MNALRHMLSPWVESHGIDKCFAAVEAMLDKMPVSVVGTGHASTMISLVLSYSRTTPKLDDMIGGRNRVQGGTRP
jgi:hypothetical protein